MKKKLLTFTILVSLALVGTVSFIACNHEEETYSCDVQIDNLLKADLNKYSNLSRAEWLNLPDSLKIPVFRTFSNEKKLDFWKEKHRELLELKWTDAEKNHIDDIYSFLYDKVNIFEYYDNKEAKQLGDSLLYTFNKWYEESVNTYGWSVAKIYALVGIGDRYSDDLVTILDRDITITGRYYREQVCDCNSSFLCRFWRAGDKCVKFNCATSKGGCAIFYLLNCEGECVYE